MKWLRDSGWVELSEFETSWLALALCLVSPPVEIFTDVSEGASKVGAECEEWSVAIHSKQIVDLGKSRAI